MTEKDMHIFIAGIKHCGKTTLAERLANAMDIPYVDADSLMLQQIHPMTVRGYYRNVGKECFQQTEADTLECYLSEVHADSIVSLGGGACENKTCMELCHRYGLLLYLNVGEQTLWERIIRDGIPPFLETEDPRNTFHGLYLMRDGLYRKEADLIVDIPCGSSREATFEKVWNELKNREEIWQAIPSEKH
ncbi:MAG: hypothetical protein LKE40_03190 [Spirochaetia bacterium]|jgi:shikimate kinase|nr:hypothetical protein [Spirochaetia bacterium]